MAGNGILDFFGLGSAPQGGILGGAGYSQTPGWVDKVGLFGAGLADAGAALAGKPGAATNLDAYSKQMQAHRLLGTLNSPDPAVRQQGYQAARALGIDTTPFEKSQASQALPQLMTNSQPMAVAVTPEVGSTNPAAPAQRAAAQAINASPDLQTTPTFQQSLALTGVPELTAEMAPQLIQAQMDIQAKTVRQATPAQKIAGGYKATDPVTTDIYGNLSSAVKPQAALDQENTEISARPLSKAEIQAHSDRMAALNKPVPMGVNGMFDPRTGKVFGGTDLSPTPPSALDPSSNNLSAQTGLPDMAIKFMTGQTKGMRLGQAMTQKLNDVVTQWGIKNGINTSTLQPQVSGAFDVIENNIKRNNQGKILENEITGSVQNLGPLADAIHSGRVSMANIAAVWAGKQVNDPTTLQYADQLGRLREELAGYNAVAGGHLMQNGTPAPTPDDYHHAEALITNGINSGGVQALAKSVAMSAEKNRTVLENAIEDSNDSYFKLFGAKYHRAGQEAGVGGVPDPSNLPRIAKPGQTKTGVKFQILGQ